MYADMANGYKNVNNWRNSCNQPTNQPTNRIAWYFLRAIKPNITEKPGLLLFGI